MKSSLTIEFPPPRAGNGVKCPGWGGRCWSVDLTGTSTRCLSNEQNNTWLLFSCSTRQWDIELNTRKEISYFCAPMCYNLYVVRSFWSRTRKHLSAPNSHFEFDYTTQTMFYRLKPTYYNQNMIIYWIRQTQFLPYVGLTRVRGICVSGTVLLGASHRNKSRKFCNCSW